MGGRCCGWMASRLERRPSDGYRFAPPILRAISRSRIARSLSPGAHLCDPLGQAALRAQRNLLKRFNLMLPVQSPWQKYSGSLLTQITSPPLAIPAHTQGAFRDRHERKVGMRWTRAALLTRALFLRTVKSCGPDAPTLASSSREASFLGAMVARKPGHQGEREGPR
jgi:hypothetical protein